MSLQAVVNLYNHYRAVQSLGERAEAIVERVQMLIDDPDPNRPAVYVDMPALRDEFCTVMERLERYSRPDFTCRAIGTTIEVSCSRDDVEGGLLGSPAQLLTLGFEHVICDSLGRREGIDLASQRGGM